MDGRTPSAALGANSKTAARAGLSANDAANARWNAIVTRSANPAKRTVDVTCVVLIQLLILMILGDEKYRATCRDCYVLAPDSILSRLEQGDDFGLPLPMAASIRLIVRMLRAQYNLGQDYIDRLTAPQTCPNPTNPVVASFLPFARGRGLGRGLHRVARSPRQCQTRHHAQRSYPTPIALGHHPPARSPPFQNSAFPIAINSVQSVTITQ